MRAVDLFAIQAKVTADDYRSAESFQRKIDSFGPRLERKSEQALAVFPEEIGTFLGLAGEPSAQHAKTVNAALLRVAARHLPQLLRTMVSQRLRPSLALLRMRGQHARRIYLETFSAFARKYRLTVVAGSLLTDDGGPEVYNTSYTFGPDGEVLSVTRKVNLVPTLEDALHLSPGSPSELRAVDTPCGRVGTLICYDGFAVPHSKDEPGFCTTAQILDQDRAEILAQPSANPWPWDGPWRWNSAILRRDQWMREGLYGLLPQLSNVRWAVNPMLIGQIFDHGFDGRSYIFRRHPDGRTEIAAEARTTDSEEVVATTTS